MTVWPAGVRDDGEERDNGAWAGDGDVAEGGGRGETVYVGVLAAGGLARTGR
jgi:hypothetical protein